MTHILLGLPTNLHHFQLIDCDVYVQTSIVFVRSFWSAVLC